ncbi:MAG: GNAT family N-acetyltransferase [Pseudomonadota bacterium]
MKSSTEIRTLVKDDWADWKRIRLEAIKLHPDAFGGSYEDEVQNPDESFQQGLTKNTIFGALSNGVLVGVAGFFIFSHRKMQHRGNLFSMYLRKEHRGQGIADQLIETVIAHAKSEVLQLHCTVVTNNPAAIKLYQKYGFEIYGTEPRSLKVDNSYYDEHLMALTFDT